MNGEDPPLHDPCTIAYVLRPELFTAVPAEIRVECEGTAALGHTAVEFRLKAPSPIRWVTRVDSDGVYDLLLERLAR